MNKDQAKSDIQKRVDDIEFKANRNKFSSLEVFNKSIQVNGIVRLKNYASNPSPANVGDVCVVNGKLTICTVGGTSPTWVVVGSQS